MSEACMKIPSLLSSDGSMDKSMVIKKHKPLTLQRPDRKDHLKSRRPIEVASHTAERSLR